MQCMSACRCARHALVPGSDTRFGVQEQVAQLKASRDKLIAQVSMQLAETDRMSVESTALAQVKLHIIACLATPRPLCLLD